MVEHGKYLVFQDWKELNKTIFNNLKMYFGIKSGIFSKVENDLILSIDGTKLPKSFIDLLDIKVEEISDYEGLNEETKVPCLSFKVKHVERIFEHIFNFKGIFKEITFDKPGVLDTENKPMIYYLSSETNQEAPEEMIFERIEEALTIMDGNDDGQTVMDDTLTLLWNILSILKAPAAIIAELEEKQMENQLL